MGHGLVALLMGGNVTEVSISLFSTGFCGYQLPGPGLLQRAAVDLAGIVANLASGAVALMIVERKRLKWEPRVILCIFAMVSIGSQFVYLVTGTYYGYGDPLIFKELLGSTVWPVWSFFLVLIAPSTYLLARVYLKLQEEWAPCDSMRARFSMLFFTLIVASFTYAVFFWTEDQTTGFLGGMAASERRIARMAEEAVEGQLLTKEVKTKQVRAIIRKSRPFPIIAPILVIAFSSGGLAFLKARNAGAFPVRHRFRVQYLGWSLLASLLVGGMIAWLQVS